MNPQRRQLRTRLRRWRRAVATRPARLAATDVARRVARSPGAQRASRLAVYLASDGELDLAPLLRTLRSMGKRLYLPVLHPHLGLRFVHWRAGGACTTDALGMAVPQVQTPLLPARALDGVLLPLVGFDRHGARLGRGGGHYDRALRALPRARRPWLVGVAYEGQRVAQLTPGRWDVPLDAVVTERGIWHRGRRYL